MSLTPKKKASAINLVVSSNCKFSAQNNFDERSEVDNQSLDLTNFCLDLDDN